MFMDSYETTGKEIKSLKFNLKEKTRKDRRWNK